jgi:hypothetical protein
MAAGGSGSCWTTGVLEDSGVPEGGSSVEGGSPKGSGSGVWSSWVHGGSECKAPPLSARGKN